MKGRELINVIKGRTIKALQQDNFKLLLKLSGDKGKDDIVLRITIQEPGYLITSIDSYNWVS